MELGLLLLRVVIGALLVGHGTQKLFGWFGGPGPEGTRGMFLSLGYRRPGWMAYLAGASEAGAGALLIVGLLTPLAAAAIIGVMLNAIVAVHLSNGPWVSDGGYEYNLVLIAAAAGFAFAGPGAVSLDAALGLGMTGFFWGMAALILGLVVGGAVLAARTTPEEVEAEEEERFEQQRAA